jgi:retron-type reverse transcriptase
MCSAVFLDIAQAFDRVWHNGLLHKLRSTLPDDYYRLLKSYLTNRHFCAKHEDSYSELKLIKAGVPQGSVLEPVLHLLYVNNIPTTLYSTTATFADDTAVVAIGESDENSTKKLQSAINKIAIWTKKWRIKLN